MKAEFIEEVIQPGDCGHDSERYRRTHARRGAGGRGIFLCVPSPAPYCQIWESGPVTLYHGDCRHIIPLLPIADAVITDPPYGLQANKANAHSHIRDNDKWAAGNWDNKRPDEVLLRKLPLLAPRVAIWGGNYFADCLPASGGWLIWRKPEAETGFSLADAELCWTSLNFAPRMKTFARRDGRDGNLHPTQKPVALMAWTMDRVGLPEGTTVLDPFTGSGTTAIACIRTGRRFIGIEKDAAYFEVVKARIESELSQGRLF